MMNINDWSIDTTCGRPILTYKGCSVIEAEDAEFVISLLKDWSGKTHIRIDIKPVAFIDKSWTLVYYQPPMNMGLKIGDNLYRQEQPARDSCAIADVIAERQRQQSVEGFSTEQDDTYVGCQLAAAAICYIEPMEAMSYWPADWHDDSFKPTNERRNLVKAAALIIAEIERIDRKSDTELKNE